MKKRVLCLAAAMIVIGAAGTVKAESVLDKVRLVWEEKIQSAAELFREAVTGNGQEAPVSLGNMYTTENLTLRAQATKESEKLAVVPINAEVAVYDKSGESYFQIEYKGKVGYVLGAYLTEDKEEAEKAEQEALEEERKRAEAERKASYEDDDDDDDYYEDDDDDWDDGSEKKNDAECLTGGILN